MRANPSPVAVLAIHTPLASQQSRVKRIFSVEIEHRLRRVCRDMLRKDQTEGRVRISEPGRQSTTP
jgi:hypothetical protein